MIFSQSSIIVIIEASHVEKMFKFPFESVEYVRPSMNEDNSMSLSILAKVLQPYINPFLIFPSKSNEIQLAFKASEGLNIISHEQHGYSSNCHIPVKDFYEFQVSNDHRFTLIMEEFVRIIGIAEKRDTLVRISVPESGSPVIIGIEGFEDLAVRCIMSPMTNDDRHANNASEEVESKIGESEGEIDNDETDDDFAIPRTPDYIY